MLVADMGPAPSHPASKARDHAFSHTRLRVRVAYYSWTWCADDPRSEATCKILPYR
jgi:hypothetical protein